MRNFSKLHFVVALLLLSFFLQLVISDVEALHAAYPSLEDCKFQVDFSHIRKAIEEVQILTIDDGIETEDSVVEMPLVDEGKRK